MLDNPKGELNPVIDNRRCWKKNSPSVLSCIVQRTKEGCDSDSEVETIQSGRGGEEPVPLRKLKEPGKK